MTEGVQIAIRQSPLDEVHKSLGAVMAEGDGWSLPASYGDELFEYAAVRERGAGLIDLSARGRLLVTGSEAVPFLNGLVTNDMKTLAENHWMPAVFPNVQGRLLASVRIIRNVDDKSGKKPVPSFMIDTEARSYERVLQTIERFTVAGDFHVADLTSQTALLSVQGKEAAKKTETVLGAPAAAIADESVTHSLWKEESVTVIRASHTGEDGFDFVINATHAAGLWDALVSAGARPTGHNALEILRIEAGIPRYGQDMDDTYVVTETNLDNAVSYTKGCYIGQEIIARIKYRGHVAKKLSGVVFERAVNVGPGMAINSADDKEIGRVTSATYSPHLGHTIALGYLKYDYLAQDTRVAVVSRNGEIPCIVTDLPLVRRTQP